MSYKINGTTVLSGTTMTNIAGIDGQAIAGFRHTYGNGPWTTVHSITLASSALYIDIPVHQTAIASEGSIFPAIKLRFNRVRTTSSANDVVGIRVTTGDASSSTLITSGYNYFHTGGSWSSGYTGNLYNSNFSYLRLTGGYGNGSQATLGHSGEYYIFHNPDFASGAGDLTVIGESVTTIATSSFPGQVVNWCHFGGGHVGINGANLYKLRIYPAVNSGNAFSIGSQFSLSYCFDNNLKELEQSGA